MGMQNYTSTPGRHINLHIVKISSKNLQKQKEDQTVFYWKVKTSNIFTIMDLIAAAGNDAFELRVSCNSLRSSSTPPNAAGSRLTSGFSERSSRRKRVPSNARAGTDPMRFAASVSSAYWITVGLKFGTDVRPQLRQLMTYNTWGELCRLYTHTHTHTHTHIRLTAICPGLPGWAGTRKVKPIRILLKQETVSGSGISWVICKSAPRSRQITMPAPHRSVFYRPDALPATQPTASKHWRLYRGWNDVTESMVTILSRHFVGITGTMCAVNGRRFTLLFN